MKENKYLTAYGINYAGAIPKIKKKSKEQLQPIFEAITNSLEAIRQLQSDTDNGKITIKFIFKENLFSKENSAYDFQEIIIEDTGIGFNDEEFKRLIDLNDEGKGFLNKGSGRVQFLHYFSKTEYTSIYKDENSSTGFKQRTFTLSKSQTFLDKNAIIRLDEEKDIEADLLTTVTFKAILSDKDDKFYKKLTCEELRGNIITHYLAYFCENRDELPQINIQFIINNEIKDKLKIVSDDIPAPDQQKDIAIYYCKISSDGRSIKKTKNKELLDLKAFKINKDKLDKNGLKLTSKGEIAKDIKLESLLADDHIDDNRYLFLLSGDYINKRDSDTRGEINIPTKDEFKKNYSESLFNEEEILLDDIEERTNQVIEVLYEEIRNKKEEKQQDVEELKNMFLLNKETIKSIKIGLNDTDDKILEKVYQADAKVIAKRDAEIKQQIKQLEELNPNETDYLDSLKAQVDELVKAIPLQNRTALIHYVARRKLVLDIFDKILEKQLDIQKTSSRNIDEKLLHNLIFQQSSDNTADSDLWLINEDFVYFKGKSEGRLNDIEIDGQKIFKNEFTQEEDEYLHSLGENRKINKPDVLLFPDEGKCIIIEFKNPDVNVSVHLSQINKYASLIRNFSIDNLQIDTFYGYLIGEGINARDVRAYDGDFQVSYHFDYLFRPSKTIPGEGRSDGSIYSEVLKYSTLLERAKMRNKVFIEKIT